MPGWLFHSALLDLCIDFRWILSILSLKFVPNLLARLLMGRKLSRDTMSAPERLHIARFLTS